MTVAEKEAELDQLLLISSLDEYSDTKSLEILQKLIDYSFDLGIITGSKKAIELVKTINPKIKFSKYLFVYHYNISNAWADLRKVKHKTMYSWLWEQEELEQQIVNLRLALQNYKKEDLKMLCPAWTNLASCLDSIGRFVASLENWNRALNEDKNFGMALGTKGSSLMYHSQYSLYDKGHKNIYFIKGYQLLKLAVSQPLHEKIKSDYVLKLKHIDDKYPELESININLNASEDSTDNEEKKYREWCLLNTLFLNPLNDLGNFTIAKHDPFTLPSMIISIDKAGSFHSFFNQIKQEFITARYLFYEGIFSKNHHFADKEVLKWDLFDFAQNTIKTEKLKIAFRLAYSIFDKVAYFLNYYLNLKIPEKKVNFNSIWFDKNRKLRPEFIQKTNLLFRALYWLSKDLYYKDEDFKASIEPDAKELSDIRNYIEHKSFRIFSKEFINNVDEIAPKLLKDNISYTIDKDNFILKTLKIIKLAREAIIYLSLGIYWEERHKDGGNISSINLNTQL